MICMKETYRVKCPKRIIFGDPQYFTELKGAKLKSLTVDYKPRSHFSSRVVIEEKPFESFPQRRELTINIYLAPEDEIETYMENMMYQGQKVEVKNIGIDAPEYYLKIDEQEITMGTDGDGYWGAFQEYYRMINGRKYQDAVLIDVLVPDCETMDDLRKYVNYFFKDVEQIENVKEYQELIPQSNM